MKRTALRQVAREGLERLLVACGMAGVGLLVLGGSRWFVWKPTVVVSFLDLYGSVALLWLVSSSRAVGDRLQKSAHSAMLGSASGVVLFQLLDDFSVPAQLAAFAAGILPASAPKRWTGRAAAIGLATLAAAAAATWDDESLFWLRAALVRVLFVAPIFVGHALYLRSPRNPLKTMDRSELLRRLSFGLAVLAALELVGTPTSLLLLED